MPGGRSMRNRFIKMTSGWIPVSVMLLFAAALVTGQTRTGLAPETGPLPAVSALSGSTSLLDPNDKARLASIRYFVDTVLPNSENVDVTTNTTDYPVDDEIATATGLLE